MSPRGYAMTARKSAVNATRQRIVLAAAHVQARKGALRTSWDEIAEEANVSRATVYHHFPSLTELVPACARLAFDLAAVPTREEAAARFAALPTPRRRLQHFVEETCRCYAAGAFWLRAAWRERDLVPEMGVAVRRLQTSLRVLLDASLEGARVAPEDRQVLLTILDFPFWDGLHSAGVPHRAIPERVMSLAGSVLREGGKLS